MLSQSCDIFAHLMQPKSYLKDSTRAMDQQTLTPPPSFRALRVRTRARTRTISDENKCFHGLRPPTAPALLSPSHSSRSRSFKNKDLSSSPSRGRTRSRVPRPGLTLNTNCATHLQNVQSNFAMPPNPACCSPPPGGDPLSAGTADDDLIFQMSPVLECSSPSAMFSKDPVGASGPFPCRGSSRVEESTSHGLAALWENHRQTCLAASVVKLPAPQTQMQVRHKRSRTGTITQHRRGVSDSFTPTKRDRKFGDHYHSKHLTPQQPAKTLLDLSPLLHTTPSSPVGMSYSTVTSAGLASDSEPFMYSFPSFESSLLAKARQARRRHSAERAAARGDLSLSNPGLTHSADSSIDSSLVAAELEDDGSNITPPRLGPIRARKLQIQSGESHCGELDDANFISRAFRSASLDPEKESELGDDDEDDGCSVGDSFFSQPTSISSFSANGDDDEVGTDLEHSQTSLFSTSLLAVFPVRSHSRSNLVSHGSLSAEDAGDGHHDDSQESHQATIRGRGRSMHRLNANHRCEEQQQEQQVSRGRRKLPVHHTQAHEANSTAASLASL